MADETYDYSTDPEFLKAPISVQHQYLMENEPEYAKAPKETQDRYISHLREQAPNPVAPSGMSMNKVEPLTGSEVTPQEEQDIENRAAKVKNNMITPVTDAASVIMPIASLTEPGGVQRAGLALGKSIAGTGAGAAAGGAIGAPFGHAKEGAIAGGTVGGLFGPGLIEELPAEVSIGGAKIRNPLVPRPPGVAPNLPSSDEFYANRGAEMDAVRKQNEALNARQSMFAQRAAREAARPSAEDTIAGELQKEFIKPPPRQAFRPEPIIPKGANPNEPRMVNVEKSAVAQPNRTLPSVVPERQSVPGAAGEAWSMQRRVTPELQNAARRGDPGAIETLRRLNPGWNPVVTPKGSDLESPSMERIRSAAQEPLPPSDKEIPKIERPATGSNGIKASKSITAKTGIQDKFSPEQLKQTDSIIDKLMSEPGMTTQKAQDTAQSLVDRVTNGNSIEKEVAQRNIDRIMSGKMRSAPNIKLNGAERRH